MSTPIVLEAVTDGLNELSSNEVQERLWLSDGSTGEVSSFEEAICCIFDDGGVTRAMDTKALPNSLASLFTELNVLIDKIPSNVHPRVVIDHPAMKEITKIAKSILKEINCST